MKLSRINSLILKDLRTELRDKYALGAIILYVITSTFIVYKSFQSVTVMAWNVLFWIIFLFAALNALVKSFAQETKDQYLYYYQIAHPGEIIIAKIVYNVLMLLLVSLALYFTLSLFTIDPVVDRPLFFITILMGSIGVSTCFTFVASILSTQNNQSTMMAILSLPLIIPILLLLINLSANAVGILKDTDFKADLILLGGIDLILFGLAVVIFPIIWRS